MIKPTIGRVVWFWASTEHSKEGERGNAQPLCALVTHVHNDHSVNLAVFDKEGDHFPHPVVYLWQGEGDRPTGCCYAEWMPDQKGQAAKTDVLTQEFARLAALEVEVEHLKAKLTALANTAAAAAGIVPDVRPQTAVAMGGVAAPPAIPGHITQPPPPLTK